MDIISNIPATLEWHVYKGDTTTMTIVVQDDQGTDIDLSTYEFLGQIRQEPSDEEALQDLAITSNTNVLTVAISETETLPRMSYFDIQATKEDETVVTLLKGYIYTEDDISR
jgi:hypothetical protein